MLLARSGPTWLWPHLQVPCRSCSASLASTVSPPSRVSCTLRSLHTLPRSLVLSVHLLFAHLALSSLSHLSSEVSSSKRPLSCSVPVTGGVPSGVLPRLPLLPHSSEVVTRQSCLLNTSPNWGPLPWFRLSPTHPAAALPGLPAPPDCLQSTVRPAARAILWPCIPKLPGTQETLH